MAAIFDITCEIDLIEIDWFYDLYNFFSRRITRVYSQAKQNEFLLLPQPISSSDVSKISRATQRLKHDWHSEKKDRFKRHRHRSNRAIKS